MSAICPLLRRLNFQPLRGSISRFTPQQQQRCSSNYEKSKVKRREQQDPTARREALLLRNGEEYPLIVHDTARFGRVFRHKEFVERYDKMLKRGEKLEQEKVTIRGALLGMLYHLVVEIASRRMDENERHFMPKKRP